MTSQLPLIEIINTPGHVPEHLSLIVKTTDGKVGIAGDAIWRLDEEKQVFSIDQTDHNQAEDMDMNKLIGSRKLILEKSDWIIPGHGKMFKSPK